MLIREVMTVPAVTVTAQMPATTALSLMHEEQLDSIPVVDCRGAVIGIINETQLVLNRTVGESMTHRVVILRPDDDIEAAVDEMRSTIEHLPVAENDRVIGTIRYSDLVGLLADRAEHGPGDVTAGTVEAPPGRR